MRERTMRLKDFCVVIGCSSRGGGPATHARDTPPERAASDRRPESSSPLCLRFRRWRERRNRRLGAGRRRYANYHADIAQLADVVRPPRAYRRCVRKAVFAALVVGTLLSAA